jgi:hypothetical protein
MPGHMVIQPEGKVQSVLQVVDVALSFGEGSVVEESEEDTGAGPVKGGVVEPAIDGVVAGDGEGLVGFDDEVCSGVKLDPLHTKSAVSRDVWRCPGLARLSASDRSLGSMTVGMQTITPIKTKANVVKRYIL